MWFALLLLAQAGDFTIAPGRAGPITASATRNEVRALFPPGSVVDDEIELDEGMVQSATIVYRGDPSRALAISWTPEGHPKQVFVCFGRRRGVCQWQLANGIKIGTRLAELESINSKPFTIHGFGYNYGGNVESWGDGKLATLDCNGRVVLTLDGDRARGDDYSIELTSEERHAISGDRPVSSSTPAMRKLNPAVVGILVQFAAAGGKTCP